MKDEYDMKSLRGECGDALKNADEIEKITNWKAKGENGKPTDEAEYSRKATENLKGFREKIDDALSLIKDGT